MPGSYFILLPVLMGLCGYLYFSFSRRWRATETAQQESGAREWRPSVLDASLIAPRLERLREDYSAAARCRSRRGVSEREQRLAAAAQSIRSLPWFCRLREQSLAPDEQEHGRQPGTRVRVEGI